ncbi:hypothetical protein BCR42DRAFT_443104 [Absidia repens]|uniref:Uncharacterized protein n=1 Tax=Absidia repens TaxID=90262 RepID=A0A1X2I0H5_9FUNG|nr:hypothetical protein BCR42DRAFT_443104 [Absidia repens]
MFVETVLGMVKTKKYDDDDFENNNRGGTHWPSISPSPLIENDVNHGHAPPLPPVMALSHFIKYDKFFETNSHHHYHQNQPLPLTSSNLEILQMENSIHVKHQHILSYVKNQVSILTMEAKLHHQRWREIQTLVPLEKAPFEKEIIICCVDDKDDAVIDSHYTSNHIRDNDKQGTKGKISTNVSNNGEYKYNPIDEKNESPKLQKRYSHRKQKYDQEKMELVRRGLCGLSSSIVSSAPSSLIEDYHHQPLPNHLASLLFSTVITSCTSSDALTSSSLSLFNTLRDSNQGDSTLLLSNDSELMTEKLNVLPEKKAVRNDLSTKEQYSGLINGEEKSIIKYWLKQYKIGHKIFGTKSSGKKCLHHTHHDYADFLAFRYPKMIPFHKLRDTALQVLLSPDQLQK